MWLAAGVELQDAAEAEAGLPAVAPEPQAAAEWRAMPAGMAVARAGPQAELAVVAVDPRGVAAAAVAR